MVARIALSLALTIGWLAGWYEARDPLIRHLRSFREPEPSPETRALRKAQLLALLEADGILRPGVK